MVISSSLPYFNCRLAFRLKLVQSCAFETNSIQPGKRTMEKSRLGFYLIFLVGCLFGLLGHAQADGGGTPPKVGILRVPHGGLQPQVVVDQKGKTHLIYFQGEPANGDVYYARMLKNEERFSEPMRVNSTPGSAIAIGNIRGPQMALGKNGRVHVAWNGSGKAVPIGPQDQPPMIYTRLNDAGTAFEPERNVIQSAYGLDGGGSVAADDAGNIYVAWHAPKPDARGEENRCVWLVHSSDEGKTFSPERQAFSEPTGACGCCGMKAFADNQGAVYFLYRSAREKIHRDMYLLTSADKGARFQGEKLHEWEGGTCPMSLESFCQSRDAVLAAWETADQVYFARVDPNSGQRPTALSPPGEPKGRKHPVIASNDRGQIILAWTEGMGWQKGGSVAWQVFDKEGKSIGEIGRVRGVPTWSLVAAFARPDGSFTVVY
jgi:hypothetical protein